MLKFPLVHIWETIIGQLLNRLQEIKWSLPELISRINCSQLLSVFLVHTCAGVKFQMLWVGELIHRRGGKREHCVWSIKWFFTSLVPMLPKSLLPLFISVTVLSGEWKLQDVSVTQPTHNHTKWNKFSSVQARITVERICILIRQPQSLITSLPR